MSVTGPTVGDPATLELIGDLCRALDGSGVRWCHWKSNAALDRTRSGRNDLDLLVHREHRAAFVAVLEDLGFKTAIAPPAKALPGVTDHYGHDPATGRLVHVHAHSQLVVGDDLTKNYRIPLEEAYLTAGTRDGEFPVPTPELELILLVIRLVIKHGTWDAFAAHLARIPESARVELAHLQARADRDSLHRDLRRWLPAVDPATFDACERSLDTGTGWLERARAGRRLLLALRACARRPRAADVGLKFTRRTTYVLRRLARRPGPRKRLAGRGTFIAFIGADGAGKSSAIDEIHEWLEGAFAVTRVHLGRPPARPSSRVGRALVLAPSVPSALLRRHTSLLKGPPPARSAQHAALAVLLARDRLALARRGHRTASEGCVVLADRFPLPQLTLMDAPRVHRLLDVEKSRLARCLSSLEQRCYRAMVPPDTLIVLMVDPDVAVARKPEEPEDFIRSRWAALWKVDWSGTGAHVIDAGRPREEVRATVKSVIWSEL